MSEKYGSLGKSGRRPGKLRDLVRMRSLGIWGGLVNTGILEPKEDLESIRGHVRLAGPIDMRGLENLGGLISISSLVIMCRARHGRPQTQGPPGKHGKPRKNRINK